MAKYIPSKEELETILTRYRETKNYSQVSRETGVSTVIIKRLIEENDQEKKKKSFSFTGLLPQEENEPISKAKFYYHLIQLRKEYHGE